MPALIQAFVEITVAVADVIPQQIHILHKLKLPAAHLGIGCRVPGVKGTALQPRPLDHLQVGMGIGGPPHLEVFKEDHAVALRGEPPLFLQVAVGCMPIQLLHGNGIGALMVGDVLGLALRLQPGSQGLDVELHVAQGRLGDQEIAVAQNHNHRGQMECVMLVGILVQAADKGVTPRLRRAQPEAIQLPHRSNVAQGLGVA